VVGASGNGKIRGIRAGYDVLLSFPVEAGKRSVSVEPGLGLKDAASDRFAAAAMASFDGVLYREHNRLSTPTTIKTVLQGRFVSICSRVVGDLAGR
jgi:hypothetical protein